MFPDRYRFIKYVMVGVVNSLFGYMVIWICINLLDISYVISEFIGYVIGLFVSYILNTIFTFSKKMNVWIFVRFVIVFIISFLFSYLISKVFMLFVEKYFPTASKFEIQNVSALISLPVYTILSYLGNKIYTFKSQTYDKKTGDF